MRFAILNDTIGEVIGSNQACERIGSRLVRLGHRVAWLGVSEVAPTALEAIHARSGIEMMPLKLSRPRGLVRALAGQIWNPSACRQSVRAMLACQPDVAIVCNIHNGLSSGVIDALATHGLKTVFYAFDDWSWCARKYAHVPGEEGACHRCAQSITSTSIALRCGGPLPFAAFHYAVHRYVWSARGPFANLGGWIAPTAWQARMWEHRGVKADRIAVLPFPVETEEIQASATGPVVYYGGVMPAKGMERVLRALGRLSGMEVDLYVTGAFSREQRKLLDVARRSNRVCVDHELRWTTGLRERIRTARAVLVPTAWESVGEQTFFEPRALGKCVVASDINVHRARVEDGVDGVLVAGEECGAWASALERVWRDPAGAQRMGDAARQRTLVEQRGWDVDFVTFARTVSGG